MAGTSFHPERLPSCNHGPLDAQTPVVNGGGVAGNVQNSTFYNQIANDMIKFLREVVHAGVNNAPVINRQPSTCTAYTRVV